MPSAKKDPKPNVETVTKVARKPTNKERLEMLRRDQASLSDRNEMRADPMLSESSVVYPASSSRKSYSITRDELDKPVREQYSKGGKVRGDGICQRGRTKGRMV